ncbi:hypothetical protein A3Q56_07945 [Intoshia linei]|uniref:Vesicle transport protein USE1 n=1 Tax=Intoshia linei TaxID=1819745 RepID=A0A177AS47_9BILA|nr:hypothetical protein A3Q56_07945 [Intoshia linei]
MIHLYITPINKKELCEYLAQVSRFKNKLREYDENNIGSKYKKYNKPSNKKNKNYLHLSKNESNDLSENMISIVRNIKGNAVTTNEIIGTDSDKIQNSINICNSNELELAKLNKNLEKKVRESINIWTYILFGIYYFLVVVLCSF